MEAASTSETSVNFYRTIRHTTTKKTAVFSEFFYFTKIDFKMMPWRSYRPILNLKGAPNFEIGSKPVLFNTAS
jgi:hypothetical protein